MSDSEGALKPDSLWFHVLVLIPIEWGILHSTPLGPWLTSLFSSGWQSLGFEFASHAQSVCELGAHGADALSCSEHAGHLHGTFEKAVGDSASSAAETVVEPKSEIRNLFDKDRSGDIPVLDF